MQRVQERIRAAAEACGRDAGSVRLVAVTKTFGPDALREAVAAGATDIGENYIQEAREKFDALGALPVRRHFIGHLQSHTVDSVKLGRELDRCARRSGKRQAVLVQVNVAGESSKSGVAPDEALPLVQELAALEHLSVAGLMTMPPFFNDPERVRPFFSALRQLRDRIQAKAPAGISLRELSMGMTGDFEAAIAEGATLVRIGTAIFGERS
ncbi:MAG: YggS family pyridoxal phosphate-dependent enzyme [Desulfobacterales bacterium]|nr:YggS family pyridoxal phosphate-dependent enzyme [Desulfobacterales bacterium]